MAHQADRQTMQLVLIRHGESEWNKLNLFTGWTDVELTDTGREEAAAGGRALKEAGFDFDVCYTSRLKRAIHTLDIVLGQMDREWLPVIKSWKLNERHYGALQGLNKADAAATSGFGLDPVLSNLIMDNKLSSGSEKLYSIKVYNASETAIPDMILCKPLMHYIRANYPGSRTQVGLYRSVVESEQSVSPANRMKENI